MIGITNPKDSNIYRNNRNCRTTPSESYIYRKLIRLLIYDSEGVECRYERHICYKYAILSGLGAGFIIYY